MFKMDKKDGIKKTIYNKRFYVNSIVRPRANFGICMPEMASNHLMYIATNVTDHIITLLKHTN